MKRILLKRVKKRVGLRQLKARHLWNLVTYLFKLQILQHLNSFLFEICLEFWKLLLLHFLQDERTQHLIWLCLCFFEVDWQLKLKYRQILAAGHQFD